MSRDLISPGLALDSGVRRRSQKIPSCGAVNGRAAVTAQGGGGGTAHPGGYALNVPSAQRNDGADSIGNSRLPCRNGCSRPDRLTARWERLIGFNTIQPTA